MPTDWPQTQSAGTGADPTI